MKKLTACFLALVLLLSLARPAAALNGQVIYKEDARKYFFLPGTDYSPTDLFPELKDVMPGDTLRQGILLKNDASNRCKIMIYLRALGAHPDSEAFLSQLKLTVTQEDDTVLFDAPADQTAQLTDWVYLGTLYSGGECELSVNLEVPVTLDNRFQDFVGYLDWEFAVEERLVEPGDPEPPKTGDDTPIGLWMGLMAGSLLILLLLCRRKKDDE